MQEPLTSADVLAAKYSIEASSSSTAAEDEDITDEELAAMEKRVEELDDLLAKRRIQMAYGVYVLLVFIVVQFVAMLALTFPVFSETDNDG